MVSDPGNERDGWALVRPGRERFTPEGRQLQPLDVTLRVHGRDVQTWKGQITTLPASEAKTIPLGLSNRAGGPVAVKPPTPQTPGNMHPNEEPSLVPQAQHYLVYIDVLDPDAAIVPGTRAQVKIYCQPETCLRWAWRTINNTFDLGLW